MSLANKNLKEAFLLFCSGLSALLLLLALIVLFGRVTGSSGLSILSLIALLIPMVIIASIPAIFLYSLSMRNGQEMTLFLEYRYLLISSPYVAIFLIILLIVL